MGRYLNEELIEPRLNRLGEEKYNNQGCLMRIIEYKDCKDITVQFQDNYRAKIHTSYRWFLLGNVKNPYHPSVYEVGIIGAKYPKCINKKHTKEYIAWTSMLKRCFSKKLKDDNPTYNDVVCCEDWLLYEKFYEWIHNQENFNKWLCEAQWNLDKDILIKGNKIYSQETCCLVPHNVNLLFAKRDAKRGSLPIGVIRFGDRYRADCRNPFTNKHDNIGYYDTPEKAFQAYKAYKEDLIKQVAQLEFSRGNIIKRCYDAMMKYEVEITD